GHGARTDSSALEAPPKMHAREFAVRVRLTSRAARTVLLAFLLLSSITPNAFASGTISGHVTDSVTTLALPNTAIAFYDGDNDVILSPTATTDASGNYTATLRAGTYLVFTQARNGYINKAWNNVSCSAVCDVNSFVPLVVTNGGAITGIDFALVPGG